MTDQFLTVAATTAGDGVTVLSATGELDRETRRILGDAADEALRSGRWLVLDLTGVTFCDSGGLSLFVEIHRKAAALGGELRLAALQEEVTVVVRATNLDRLLLVHPTVEHAVGAVGQTSR